MNEPRRPQIDFPQENKLRIGVTPGAIIGSLVGIKLAKNSGEKKINKLIRDEQARINNSRPSIEGDYYSQVKNVAKNLQVVFTPMSAIFIVKNGNKSFTLDTIETTEMNNSMKVAWKNKDEEYFKSLLISKIYSEMQIAEKEFSKMFIEKNTNIKDSITKTSSDLSFLDDLMEDELFEITKKQASVFNNPELEKLADAVGQDIENELGTQYLSLKLDRPFEKYAGIFQGIKDCLGLHSEKDNVKKIKRHLENPMYVMHNIKIGFFPDRVIYSLDNQLVGTLTLTNMNQEGYDKFLKRDTKYFKNFFINWVKSQKNNSFLNKNAEEENVAVAVRPANSVYDCLNMSETHPVTIYLLLTNKLGPQWLQYDMMIIDTIIKREFGIDEISEPTLNKILSIMTANQSDSVYVNAFAFEKSALGLCSKPLEMLKEQQEQLNMQDIVFTIDVLDRVTPYDDVYDNFGKEIMNFISDVLASKEIYIYSPTKIVSSPLEPAFNASLNEYLLKAIKSKMSMFTTDEKLIEKIHSECEYIADNSMAILKSLRRTVSPEQEEIIDMNVLIDTVMRKKLINPRLSNIIKRQVLINVALDRILTKYENKLLDEINRYGINIGMEGTIIE